MIKKSAQTKQSKKRNFFYSYWWLILFLFVLLLRLPLLFEPFTYADEGIYLTLGQALRKGLLLYRDIHDNKPPLLYLLAALTGSFSLYRLLYFLWGLATIGVFYRLAKLLFSKKQKAVITTTSLFAVLSSLPMFEGNIANAENFMLLPVLAGFYLILKFLSRPTDKVKLSWRWLTAGLLFSMAVLFKIPAIFDFLAALMICLLLIKAKTIKTIFLHLFSLILGFFIPLFSTFVFFGLKQALGQYLKAAFSQNLPYLSSWGNSAVKISGFSLEFIFRLLFLALLLLVLFIFRQKLSLVVKIVIVWFFTSVFAALLSTRPYPHYLLQILPSFCLSFGLLFLKEKKLVKIIPFVLLLFFIFIFKFFNFWYYPNWAYFKNFYQYALRMESKQDYLAFYGPQTESLYQTADFIRTHTSSEEKIFIWGNQPSIYALAKRLPVGRYTVAYHIIDFKAKKETLNVLRFQPPQWLIVSQDEKQIFPQLEAFIFNDYSLFQKYGQIEIFYRLPKISQL
jgi:hypothetical protein